LPTSRHAYREDRKADRRRIEFEPVTGEGGRRFESGSGLQLISRDFTLPAHRWSNPAPAAATNASVLRSRSACPNSARIHLIVKDIAAEVQRLGAAGLTFRNDIVSGPGGQQILLEDPAGNPIELFQPAGA
jgi:hypothetical protein